MQHGQQQTGQRPVGRGAAGVRDRRAGWDEEADAVHAMGMSYNGDGITAGRDGAGIVGVGGHHLIDDARAASGSSSDISELW